MTDDFPRDRSANPADTDDDLHDADASGTGAEPLAGDDDSFSESGLEDRNVDLDAELDQPTAAEPDTAG